MPAPKYDARQAARDLYIAGGDPSSIAKTLNLNPKTVRTWRQRFGWLGARATAAAYPKPKLKEPEKQPIEQAEVRSVVIQPEVTAESVRCRQALAEELNRVIGALSNIKLETTIEPLTKRCNLISSIVGSAKVVHGWDNEGGSTLVSTQVCRAARDIVSKMRGEVLPAKEPEAIEVKSESSCSD